MDVPLDAAVELIPKVLNRMRSGDCSGQIMNVISSECSASSSWMIRALCQGALALRNFPSCPWEYMTATMEQDSKDTQFTRPNSWSNVFEEKLRAHFM